MLYSNLVNNKNLVSYSEEIPKTISIIIYTQVELRKPIYFLDESKKSSGKNKDILDDMDPARATIYMRTESGIDVNIYVRNKMGGGRNGMPSQHAASVKITYPTINGQTNIPLILPKKKGDKVIIDVDDKKTKKIVETNFKDPITFSEYNCEDLNAIWYECKTQNNIIERIEDIISNENEVKDHKYKLFKTKSERDNS